MTLHILSKLNKRTRIFLYIAIVILVVVIFDRLPLSTFTHPSKNIDEQLSLKKDLLLKYKTAISMKDSYEKKLGKLSDQYNTIENRLFHCKTENLAQAKLQEYIKNTARRNGLIVSRSSAQKGKIISDNPQLMLVYAKVEIKDIYKIKKLQELLYSIEYENEKLVFIDDLKIRGEGFGATKGVSTTIRLSTIAKLETKT